MDFSSHPKPLAVLMGPIDQVRGNGVAVLSLENSNGPLSLYRNFQETFFFSSIPNILIIKCMLRTQTSKIVGNKEEKLRIS